MKESFQLLKLGLKDYSEAHNFQKELLKKRHRKEIIDTLILTEHKSVFTIGRGGTRKNILISEEELKKEGIEVYEVERGGDVTYHGPGQIVGYPIIDLRLYKNDIHLYLRKLEEVLIQLLGEFHITGERIENMTGVWVKNKKIAFIGIGVSKWITYHGFSLNIDPNMKHFTMINPCGLRKPVTSMKEELDGKLPLRELIEKRLVDFFGKVFEKVNTQVKVHYDSKGQSDKGTKSQSGKGTEAQSMKI